MKDEYITFEQAAEIAPTKPTSSAIWRWARRGLTSRSGEVVRLRHIRVGARLFTKAVWLDEFFAAMAESDAKPKPEPDQVEHKPIRRRRMSRDDIHRQLQEAGL